WGVKGALTPADGRCGRRRAGARCRPRCRSGSRTGRVAEQFLERAEVRPPSEQMGGEAVAERVRSGPVGEAEADAGAADDAADHLPVERPAAGAAEQGLVAPRAVG